MNYSSLFTVKKVVCFMVKLTDKFIEKLNQSTVIKYGTSCQPDKLLTPGTQRPKKLNIKEKS